MAENIYTIKSVTINNYRSFKPEDNKFEFEKFKPINILIGQNSSGKSNFANALRLLLKVNAGADYGGGYGKGEVDLKQHDFYDENKPITLKCKFYDKDKNESLAIKQYKCSQSANDNKTIALVNQISFVTCKKRFFPIGPDRSWYNWAREATELHLLNESLRPEIQKIIRDIIKKMGMNISAFPENEEKLKNKSLADFLLDENGVPSSEIGSGIGMLLYFIAEIENTKANSKDEGGMHIVLIEEPENHMHPKLQKLFMSYINDKAKDGIQFFITTHSPFIIDFSADTKYGEKTKIMNFRKSSLKDNDKYFTEFDDVSGNLSMQREMLQSIGAKASDILQPNGIIWVEGPSDIIYLRKWLELYIKNKAKKYCEPLHYSFMWYGGPTLANHISFGLNQVVDDNVVNLPDLNTNCVFIVDADDYYTGKAKNTNTNRNKTVIMEKLNNRSNNTYFWITDKNISKIRVNKNDRLTIECYLPDSILKTKTITSSTNKIRYAEKASSELTPVNYMEKNELKKHLEKIYECIKKWNE